MEGLTVLGWLAERRTSERSEWQFVFRNRRKAQEGAPPYKFFLKIFEGGSDKILEKWRNKELYCYFDTLYQNVELCRGLSPPIRGWWLKSHNVGTRADTSTTRSPLERSRLGATKSLIAFLTPQSLNFFHLQTWHQEPTSMIVGNRRPPRLRASVAGGREPIIDVPSVKSLRFQKITLRLAFRRWKSSLKKEIKRSKK